MTGSDDIEDADGTRRGGMLFDLVFALAWVTFVSVLFEFALSDAPTWALYLALLSGIPAYFGFVISMKLARENR